MKIRAPLALILYLVAALAFSAGVFTLGHHDELGAAIDLIAGFANLMLALLFTLWRSKP